MAKNKKENNNEQQINSLLLEIEKDFGKGLVRSGQSLIDNPKYIIPVSPSLDRICGGFSEGSTVMISGPEKCGKTVSSLSFCANAQSPEHGSRPVMILSAEHRLDKKTLTGIEGLKLEEPYLYFVESTKGKILTSSDFLNIGLHFLKNTPNGILLIDSVSSLVNSKTITDGIGSSDYGSGNRIVSQFLDLAAPVIRSNSCIMIGIVQLYQNTSGWGKKWVEKVAGKYKYQADTILSCDKFSLDHGDGESEPPTGQILEWTCRNSSILSPGRKCQGHIRYGVGIDRKKELMLQAIDLGLIVKGGSWFTFSYLAKDELKDTEYESKEEVKVQGEESAYQLLETYPNWYTSLNKALKEMLQ